MSQSKIRREDAVPDVAMLPEVHVAAADARRADVDEALVAFDLWDGRAESVELVRGVGRDGDVFGFEG